MHTPTKILLLALLTGFAGCSTPLTNRLGIQLWSLRHEFEANVPRGLDETKTFGFTLVETAGGFASAAALFRVEGPIARGARVRGAGPTPPLFCAASP